MPFVETRLISPTTLTTSAASALYTVPTGYSAIIKQLVVTNITGTAATFTFYIGATASASNALFSGTSVAGNDTVIINLSQVLSTGEVLRALASTGSALNLTVSGVINDGPLASTATYIPDGAITVNKIADASITTAKIAAGAVDTVDIANNAVTQGKLATTLSGTTITTNALRPTAIPSPFAGQTCYETDTNRMYVWNGTAWVIPNSPAQNPTGLELVKTQVLTGTSNLITNAFSSTYDNYKIMFDGNSTMGAVCNINMQMGTTSGSGYFSTRIKNAPNNGTPAGNGLDNIGEWGYAGQGSPSYANLNIDLFAPFLSRYTRYNGSYMIEIGSGSEFGVTQGHLANSTSYTSFTLTASQTFNATVYVYGYRK